MQKAAGVNTSILGDPFARMFAAIEAGDMTAFQDCFIPGAVVWHNHDEVAQDVSTAAQALALLCAKSSRVKYLDQTVVAVDNVRFVQHVLSAMLTDGSEFHLPAMMRVELAPDGRVARVEEYFDSRATDCLFAPGRI